MYNFLRLQYLAGRIGEDELIVAVAKGWITEKDKNEILNG